MSLFEKYIYYDHKHFVKKLLLIFFLHCCVVYCDKTTFDGNKKPGLSPYGNINDDLSKDFNKLNEGDKENILAFLKDKAQILTPTQIQIIHKNRSLYEEINQVNLYFDFVDKVCIAFENEIKNDDYGNISKKLKKEPWKSIYEGDDKFLKRKLFVVITALIISKDANDYLQFCMQMNFLDFDKENQNMIFFHLKSHIPHINTIEDANKLKDNLKNTDTTLANLLSEVNEAIDSRIREISKNKG